MKKLGVLLLTFVGVFGIANADENEQYAADSYVYGSLGTTMPGNLLPVFGLGFRGQAGHNGFDANVKGAAFGRTQSVKGTLNYLYYFTPNLKSQFYAGIGAGIKQVFDSEKRRNPELKPAQPLKDENGNEVKYQRHIRKSHNYLALSPELTFGKQYITSGGGRRFFEANITPFEFTKKNRKFGSKKAAPATATEAKADENANAQEAAAEAKIVKAKSDSFYKGCRRNWTPSVTVSYGWGF